MIGLLSRILCLLVISTPVRSLRAQDLKINSGLAIGSEAPAFDPKHVTGPDAGKYTCPMCKYGSTSQGVIAWFNTDNWDDMGRMADSLEAAIAMKGYSKLRVFIVYMNPQKQEPSLVEKRLSQFAAAHHISKTALLYVPDPYDKSTCGVYHINPDPQIRNTILVYRKRVITDKCINFQSRPVDLSNLMLSVEGQYRFMSIRNN